jgi:RHS repeat-associated protein
MKITKKNSTFVQNIFSGFLTVTLALSTIAQVPKSSPFPKPQSLPSQTVKKNSSPEGNQNKSEKINQKTLLKTAKLKVKASSETGKVKNLNSGEANPNLNVGTPVSDLFTGALSINEPLQLPESRGKVKPDLSLQYRSGEGNGWLGVGWQLEAGYVKHSVKFGLNYESNEFVLNLGNGDIDLISVGVDQYRAKIEENFLRIRKLKAPDQTPYWEVTNKSGVRFLFGQTTVSRQDEPAKVNHIFKWCLDRVVDPHGNYSDYYYTKDQNEIYLDHITFAGSADLPPNHVVKFFLAARSDTESSYSTNFLVQTAKRLRTVAIYSNDQLERAYKLEYLQSENTGRSLLSKLTQLGKDAGVDESGSVTGGTNLPVKSFNYSSQQLSFSKKSTNKIGTGIFDLNRYQFGDFNGDGKMDVFHHGNGIEEFYPNGPGSYEGGISSVQVGLSNGNGFNNYEEGAPLGSQSPWFYPDSFDDGTLNTREYFLADVNGDKSADLIHVDTLDDKLLVTLARNFKERSSWFPHQGVPFDLLKITGDRFLDDPIKFRFLDLDGDEKAEIIYISNNGKINISKFRFPSDLDHPNPPITPTVPTWSVNLGDGTPSRYYFGDFNGDGKVDILFVGVDGTLSVALFNGKGFANPWKTNVGTGNVERYRIGNFNTDGKTDLLFIGENGSQNVWLSSGSAFINSWTSNVGSGDPSRNFYFDFNGDGKDDIAYLPLEEQPWIIRDKDINEEIFINKGNSFSSGWSTIFHQDQRDIISKRVRSGWAGWDIGWDPNRYFFTDFNGDGKADEIFLDFEIVSEKHVGHLVSYSATTQPADYCTLIDNGVGGKSEITYKTKNLPFPLPVVDSIATKDGRGGSETTKFEFDGGYYQVPEREFRGFNHVKESGPVGEGGEQKIIETWFHQGNDVAVDLNTPSDCIGFMKGKPYRIRVSDGKENLFYERTVGYQGGKPNQTCDAADPYFNPPAEIDTTICDTGSCLEGKHTKNKFVYDQFGNVVEEEDFGDVTNRQDDLTIRRDYVPNELVWMLDLPATETVYEGIGAVPSLKRKAEVSFYYDRSRDCETPSTNRRPVKGDLTRIVNWLDVGTNPERIIGYDIYGNRKCVRDPRGGKIYYTYDDDSQTLPIIIEDALGHNSTFDYYGVDGFPRDQGVYGQLAKATDPNDASTVFEYDTFGREKNRVSADGSTTEWFYENFGDPNKQSVREVQNSLISRWIYFDGLGRSWREKKTGSNGEFISIDTAYDARGFVAQTSQPYFEGEETQRTFTTSTYDAQGRTISITNPDKTRRKYCYQNWITGSLDENGHFTRVTQDAYDRVSAVQQYEGIFEQCQTDLTPVLGEVERQTLKTFFEKTDFPARYEPYSSINFSYDVLNNLVETVDSDGNKTTTEYDALKRPIKVNDPDIGLWRYSYDANGNVIRREDSKNQSTYYQFDALDRIIQKDYLIQNAAGQGDLVYTYDNKNNYGLGRINTVYDKTGAVAFKYDPTGRIVEESRKLGETVYATKTSYDKLGRVAELIYPDGIGVKYEYDGPFLTNVKNSSNNVTLVRYAQYNALGQPGKIAYGNGITTQLTYADFQNSECPVSNYRLCSTSTTSSMGEVFQKFQYLYDPVGNISGIIDRQGMQVSYAYDGQNRLRATGHSTVDEAPKGFVKLPATANVPQANVESAIKKNEPRVMWDSFFAYDEIGNRTYSSERGIYDYSGPRPHAVKSVTQNGASTRYEYDGNGNVEKAGNTLYKYDPENRLSSVTRGGKNTIFSYDWTSQRVVQSTATKTTRYINKAYTCIEGASCQKSLFAGDERIAEIDSTDAYYYHKDALGSTTLVSNLVGEAPYLFAYQPFGSLLDSSQSRPERISYLFTGSEFDRSTGLYYLLARYYDPELGRFISPDTIIPSLTNPQAFNRYSYANNNPISYTDTNGHYWRDNDDNGSAGKDRERDIHERAEVRERERFREKGAEKQRANQKNQTNEEFSNTGPVDSFIFFSITGHAPAAGLESGLELAGLLGYSEQGPYLGGMLLGGTGLEIGPVDVSHYTGVERTLGSSGLSGGPISVNEVEGGFLGIGRYQTGGNHIESGSFVSVSKDIGALSVGVGVGMSDSTPKAFRDVFLRAVVPIGARQSPRLRGDIPYWRENKFYGGE